MNYFAYGSNMLCARFKDRVPSARSLGAAYLTGHHLAWHKRSVDGSGKCDIVETGVLSDVVHGVLYDIDPYEKPKLDRAEGLGNGYEQKCVVVRHQEGEKRAITYFVPHVDSRLKPYHWYKSFVVAGAQENGLPEAYVDALQGNESVQDENRERREKNEKILKDSQQHARQGSSEAAPSASPDDPSA